MGRRIKFAVCGGTALVILVLYSSVQAETKTVKMGVFKWEPYVSEEKGNYGVLPEIVLAVLEKAGYTAVITPYPFARIMTNLKNGCLDLAPAISRSREREKSIDFSSPEFELEQGFTFKKGRIAYKTVEDLKGLKGCVMRGTFWEKELDAAGIGYDEVTNQKQNIQKLALGRVDFVCMPREIAFYLIQTLGEQPDRYEFGLLRKDGQPVGISKKTRFITLRDDFEKGLAAIKSDGTYHKIISKHQWQPRTN